MSSIQGIALIGGRRTPNIIEIYNPKKLSENRKYQLTFPRYGHISGLLGENVIIAGGTTAKTSLETVQLFNVTNQKVIEGSHMNIGHSNAAATAHQGKLYIFGGSDTAICEVFDYKWTSFTSLNKRRHGSGAVSVGDNIYLIGGQRAEGLAPFRKQVPLNSVKMFNPSQNVFYKTAKMPSKRSQLAVAAIDNCIFVSGGVDNQNRQLKSCTKMDVRKGRWSKMTSMNSPRCDHVITVFNGNLLAIGGTPSTACNTIEQYDMRMDKWILLGQLKSERMQFSAVAIS